LFCGAGILAGELRIGIIGCDTSHVTAFTDTLNNPSAKGHVPGAKVVAAYQGGSRDIPESWSRVGAFSATLREKYGVRFYDTIEELCERVDAVLLESVDGRPHLGQMRAILRSQKPPVVDKGAELLLGRRNGARPRLRVFIDKPMAASLGDVREIFRLAKAAGVPVFSSSALRYGKDTQAVRHGSLGKVSSAETHSPCHLEPHHPDLVWYGIHGVESLFTVLGTGCETVRRESRPDGKVEVVGVWSGGRTGVFREDERYGGLARGELGEAPVGSFDGYEPLIVEIVKFFQTGIAPIDPEETIEMFAFMEGADESKRQNGAAVKISDVLKERSWLVTPR
jgi:hypothetical protein